jgi:hypothetical protein
MTSNRQKRRREEKRREEKRRGEERRGEERRGEERKEDVILTLNLRAIVVVILRHACIGARSHRNHTTGPRVTGAV